MQKPIKQVWHDYRLWEEIAHNMWGDVHNKNEALQRAIEFTGDHNIYGSFMKKVCDQWPISCENALTDPHLNKKAWLGHAAVAMALGIPEHITREAWGHLSDEQKYLANKEAEREVALWTLRYVQGRGLCKSMGAEVLPGWNSR